MTFALLAALACAAPPAPAQPARPDPVIDAIVADALRDFRQPGAVVLVVQPDRIAYLNAVVHPGTPAEYAPAIDSVFPLASCSKAFTAAAVAALVDDGKMAWDDPVRKWLPDFHLSDPAADQLVTVRDLLTHRTGVASHDFLWYQSPLPQEELVRRVRHLPVSEPFRGAFQYQSVMATAAGLCAAKAAAKPWDALVRERLFTPLGMAGATCTTPPATAKRATPLRATPDGRFDILPWYEQAEPNPAGSIHVRAADLAPWLQMHLNAGRGPAGRVLSVEQIRELHAPQMAMRVDPLTEYANGDTVQFSYALGWVVQDYRGVKLLTHAGLIDGFRISLTMAPTMGVGVAVLTPIEQSRMPQAITNRLLDKLFKLPERPWTRHLYAVMSQELVMRGAEQAAFERLRQPKPSRPLGDFAGTYSHAAYGAMKVASADGALTLTWNGRTHPLEFHHATTFVVKAPAFRDPPLVFGGDGRPAKFDLFGVPFARVAGAD